MTGPVLLIDLWSGFSGASIAMLSLGIKIYVLAAETNPDVAKMAEASLDQIVHVPAGELTNARMTEDIMKKRSIQAIVVGGGSLCQGNTSLNKSRKGLGDPRSLQPKELRSPHQGRAQEDLPQDSGLDVPRELGVLPTAGQGGVRPAHGSSAHPHRTGIF